MIIYLRSLLRSGFLLLRHLPALVRAYLFKGLDQRFSERLLLVVSGVNGCVYCCWFHSHVAVKRGIQTDEISQLLTQVIPGDIPVSEHPALIFAMQVAESDGRMDTAALLSLRSQYSAAEVKGIVALITAIHFGNLCGNTYDAFLQRLKGHPVTGSHVLLEMFVFLISAPFLLPLTGRV